jgi:hypothetical protein
MYLFADEDGYRCVSKAHVCIYARHPIMMIMCSIYMVTYIYARTPGVASSSPVVQL